MPSNLQSTMSECGLACLGYIAAHHGREHDMAELRAMFAGSVRGMNLADVARLASTVGLDARALRLELGELDRLALPCVLHWNMNHFVVLTRLDRLGALRVHDPALGERRISREEADRCFTGVALE